MADQEDGPELLDANRWGVLSRDAERFAIWPASGVAGEPLASFPPTDAGSDEAWAAFSALAWRGRRNRVMPAIVVVAVASAVMWVVATAVEMITWAIVVTANIETTNWTWLTWVALAGAIANTAFLASVGSYVVLWLDRRSRGDAA